MVDRVLHIPCGCDEKVYRNRLCLVHGQHINEFTSETLRMLTDMGKSKHSGRRTAAVVCRHLLEDAGVPWENKKEL